MFARTGAFVLTQLAHVQSGLDSVWAQQDESDAVRTRPKLLHPRKSPAKCPCLSPCPRATHSRHSTALSCQPSLPLTLTHLSFIHFRIRSQRPAHHHPTAGGGVAPPGRFTSAELIYAGPMLPSGPRRWFEPKFRSCQPARAQCGSSPPRPPAGLRPRPSEAPPMIYGPGFPR